MWSIVDWNATCTWQYLQSHSVSLYWHPIIHFSTQTPRNSHQNHLRGSIFLVYLNLHLCDSHFWDLQYHHKLNYPESTYLHLIFYLRVTFSMIQSRPLLGQGNSSWHLGSALCTSQQPPLYLKFHLTPYLSLLLICNMVYNQKSQISRGWTLWQQPREGAVSNGAKFPRQLTVSGIQRNFPVCKMGIMKVV